MQRLTNKEEEVMRILWKLEKAFVKDVLAEIESDKPHYLAKRISTFLLFQRKIIVRSTSTMP
jgi:predicted transcriptional regulator